jgi:hypothetical protein
VRQTLGIITDLQVNTATCGWCGVQHTITAGFMKHNSMFSSTACTYTNDIQSQTLVGTIVSQLTAAYEHTCLSA